MPLYWRVKQLGFPSGRWLSANVKIWTPREIGDYLLALPADKPVMPARAKRPPSKASAKRGRRR
jgi:hypothetical protein